MRVVQETVRRVHRKLTAILRGVWGRIRRLVQDVSRGNRGGESGVRREGRDWRM